MMTHAYSEEYLDNAQDVMGNMMDYAVNICKIDGDEYFHMFLASGIAEQFERGNPKYIAGMTGAEIVKEIVFQRKGIELQQLEEYFLDKSPEYWCGWILAYYQWRTCLSFKKIYQIVNIKEILRMYPLHHEMDEEHFVDTVNQIYKRQHTETYLCQRMRNLKITSAKLADQLGISEDKVLALETDFEKMENVDAKTLFKLAKSLGCMMEDLMELSLQ